jgi:membrane-bound lytic murein transglycosylase B
VVIKKMHNFLKKIIIFILFFSYHSNVFANPSGFNTWLALFKIQAKEKGISSETISVTLKNVVFIPKVIEYDRYQPEFYEDTFTYIKKRANNSKVNKGIAIYKNNKKFINIIEKEFLIEKELLLSLMGIETNFGTYLGKMDILSSLATLSYDKRRSEFFTNELLTILKLVDEQKIDIKILYGSWAGAVGNFQFMPSTIKNYAIDYDKNSILELKKFKDSYASAANYLNKIGWKKNEPCFYKIKLKDNIPKKYLNSSAKKINNKKSFDFFKKYIDKPQNLKIPDNLLTGIIIPDKDIVDGSKELEPAYIVFSNYELILKWNRSLRFALAVCTLKEKIKNEI